LTYRTANLQSCILYIYSTNIGTEYFKHGIYSPFFFSSKCSSFHNSNVFGSCIIHILYTGCAKIKKNNSGTKRLINPTTLQIIFRNASLQLPVRYELIVVTKTDKTYLYCELVQVSVIGNVHSMKLIVNIPLKTANSHLMFIGPCIILIVE